MIRFISDNIATIAVCVVIFVAAALALYKIIRDKISGKSGCGHCCADCTASCKNKKQ